MDVRALVFDFDGVIIDSEVTGFAAWCDVYGDYGVDLTVAEYVESMGGRHVNIYELLVRKTNVPVPDEHSVRTVKRARHAELLEQTGVLPGVHDWIAAARTRGLGLGIASSASTRWLDTHLARIGLSDAFDCVCSFDGTVAAKPAPDLYLRACERLGVAPAGALAIEDAPNGLQAAQTAGMRTVGVTHALTQHLSLEADIVTPSLDALTLDEALRRLTSAPTMDTA